MTQGRFHARIAGIEYALPLRVEENSALQAENPDWDLEKIYQKTGVARRYLAAPEQTAADLCVEAAEKLFASGIARREEIGALLFCTQSPDYALPTTACVLQDRLGLSTRTLAFDFNLGCSGFVYGLAIASALIESGLAERVLLLCGETYTKYISPDDRTCRPIFSDGGSAALIERSDRPMIGPFDLGTDGSGSCNLMVPNSGARREPDGGGRSVSDRLKMDGPSVFMFTLAAVPQNVRDLLKKAEVSEEAVDLFVFHQASRVVLDSIAENLALPPGKMVRDLDQVGNTVSATIPIALGRAQQQGKLRPGQRLLLCGFGVGYSWGSCLVEWEPRG